MVLQVDLMIGFTREICNCLHRCIIDVVWHFYFIFCVQVSETTSSPIMEPVGFRRGLDRLLSSGVSVDVVTTDHAPSIRKIMRKSYPDLRQQFDPWHVAKG